MTKQNKYEKAQQIWQSTTNVKKQNKCQKAIHVQQERETKKNTIIWNQMWKENRNQDLLKLEDILIKQYTENFIFPCIIYWINSIFLHITTCTGLQKQPKTLQNSQEDIVDENMAEEMDQDWDAWRSLSDQIAGLHNDQNIGQNPDHVTDHVTDFVFLVLEPQ